MANITAGDHSAGGRPFWQDPTVSGINRRSAHAPLRSFPSAAAAVQHYTRPLPVADLHASSPRVARLSGRRWQFRMFDRVADVPDRFWAPGFDASDFGEVRWFAAWVCCCCCCCCCCCMHVVDACCLRHPAMQAGERCFPCMRLHARSPAAPPPDITPPHPHQNRSQCPATGSARGTAPPSTPTTSTPSP